MEKLKKLTLTLALLITAAAGAWAQESEPEPGTMSLDDTKTVATMTMPASDMTVNYMLVRDLQDHESANDVHFSGLPADGQNPIVVKKGDDGKYQPAEPLDIQLIAPLAGDADIFRDAERSFARR